MPREVLDEGCCLEAPAEPPPSKGIGKSCAKRFVNGFFGQFFDKDSWLRELKEIPQLLMLLEFRKRFL